MHGILGTCYRGGYWGCPDRTEIGTWPGKKHGKPSNGVTGSLFGVLPKDVTRRRCPIFIFILEKKNIFLFFFKFIFLIIFIYYKKFNKTGKTCWCYIMHHQHVSPRVVPKMEQQPRFLAQGQINILLIYTIMVPTLKLWSKIEILVKNRNFEQK